MFIGKSTQKSVLFEKETSVEGFPATIIVKEVKRSEYKKPTWHGYGVAIRFDALNNEDEFVYRDTINKSELNRSVINKVLDWAFNVNPPKSLNEFVIQVSHQAVGEYCENPPKSMCVDY